MFNDNQRIGLGFCVFGAFFCFLAVLMLFDRGFLVIGNFLFICGVPLILGLQKTAKFFFKRSKVVGTTCFFLGILLILVRWPFIGFMVEVFGALNLFGPFASMALMVLRNAPYVGPFFRLPIFKSVEAGMKTFAKTTDSAFDIL
ncbi:Vesicle transport protein Got1/SFT2-like [Carpediemonas membranifera]|uniref:Vesicle transport protein Got1/SFT2-like n=1 Tax=Carpediemonas membranifera TaxID=201153 RepID=A0A8J6B8Y6_9EUKA|nr:Vesicle transport protein Got1/SFT2-like [Carpediemonas membranifera]|eukprot:KAG9392457.1 Vesicle transport protein Got1/SFT2-like [Carpediemonas membranifera]